MKKQILKKIINEKKSKPQFFEIFEMNKKHTPF